MSLLLNACHVINRSHGYTLEEANKIKEQLINESYLENARK
ncbi:hypothetical protein N8449_04665 [Alphaproteobacteria bacterium]|nr:hypothetical protein [Alphaproteobacteria bacterium]